MAWAKNGSTTLSGTADEINVSLTTDKTMTVLTHAFSSGVLTDRFRVGNTTVDSGSNYSRRTSTDGSADSTAVSQSIMYDALGGLSNVNKFNITYIVNITTEEKLLIGFATITDTTGAGTAPQRAEYVNKWANTSNQFDQFQNTNGGAGDYTADSNTSIISSGLTPASATTIETGSIYIDTDTNQRYFWDGSSWSLQA